jgi:hypothetical protein
MQELREHLRSVILDKPLKNIRKLNDYVSSIKASSIDVIRKNFCWQWQEELATTHLKIL